jgi:hypothetical protein
MGRISLLGTGNVAFSGNVIYTTNDNSLLFGNNLVPTSISTFSIGSSANPFKTLFISASTLQMAAPPGGNNLSILNDGSNFQISNGGLRSTVIYTGGLLLSGNNIGADPLAGNLPMTIGTNGLPALRILVPTTSTSTISTTNVVYANGGNITGNLTVSGGTNLVSLTASRIQIGTNGNSFAAFHYGSGEVTSSSVTVRDRDVTRNSYVFITINSSQTGSYSVEPNDGEFVLHTSGFSPSPGPSTPVRFKYFFFNP